MYSVTRHLYTLACIDSNYACMPSICKYEHRQMKERYVGRTVLPNFYKFTCAVADLRGTGHLYCVCTRVCVCAHTHTHTLVVSKPPVSP